jgi:hypothetical protein
MVKKYGILITLLLLKFTILSQIDTNKVCFPYEVAKKISIELIQKDSLEAELHETQKILNVFNSKFILQDSIISTLETKEKNYISQIDILTKKDLLHSKEVNELKDKNSSLTRKNKNLKTTAKILGGGFLGTLALLIVLI